MSKIPKALRDEIVALVYREAADLSWEDLSNQQKSSIYERWAADPDIGGRLSEYLARPRVRVWIKDGPMKEYKRASRGLGPYAEYMESHRSYERDVCSRALTSQWEIREGSVDVKPNQFVAVLSGTEKRVFWGTEFELKHLVWAYLTSPDPDRSLIVLVETRQHPMGHFARRQHETISNRIGAEILHISLD